MNPATELLNHHEVLALGWALVHFLWQGAVIAGALFAALTFLRRHSASARYLAGCAALIFMAASPIATFTILNRQPEPIGDEWVPVEMEMKSLAVFTAAEASPVQPPSIRMPDAAPALGIRNGLHNALPWLVVGWVGCVGALSLRLAAGYWRVRRIGNRAGEPLDEMWQRKLASLAKKLRVSRPVQLCKSALVDVPTVIGWARPMILFPAGALAGIPVAQLEAILAHELAHIRRHDYLVNLLQNLLETVLFYHPAVWWASDQVSQERELCCDDLTVDVCGDRLAYAKALAALEESRSVAPELALAADGGSLVRRIRRLLGVASEPNRASLWAAGTVVLLTLAVLFVAGRISILAATADVPSIVNPNSVVEPSRLEFRLVAEEGNDGPADELEDPSNPSPDANRLRVLKPVLLDESAIASAAVRESASGQLLGISVSLNSEGAKRFGRLTEENVSRRIAILFDGKTLSAPRIQEKITGRELVITGRFSADEINSILEALNVGRSAGISRDLEADDGYALLYGRLDSKEAGKIVAALDELRIPNRLAIDATGVLVPKEMVHRVRMKLATQGLPKESGVGFEIFDKPVFGSSDFIQRANYQRAVQAELERTIRQIHGVDSARVMIVRPESRLLADPNKKPTASVFLKLQKPDAIDEQAVHAIQFLVANSVEGLKAQYVTVVDNFGNVLAEVAPAELQSDKAAELLKETERLVETGRLAEAEAKIEELLKLHPDDYDRAALNYRKRIEEVRESNAGNKRDASKSPSATTSELIQRSRSLVELGRVEEAVTILEEAVLREPNHQGAHHYLNYLRERKKAREAQSERKPDTHPSDKEKLLHIEKSWNVPLNSREPRETNPFANLVHQSPQRRLIVQKLNQIVLEEFPRVDASGRTSPMPLGEALRELDQQVSSCDPDKRGINFIINSRSAVPDAAVRSDRNDSALRPAKGLPKSEPPLDLRSEVVIVFDPPLRNVRAKDVLDAITKVARSKRDNRLVPLQYSIEDYAVVFGYERDVLGFEKSPP